MTQSHSASDAFNDSLDFVKKLWGQMGVPGMQSAGSGVPGMSPLTSMSLPSMSVEDLDQRISDLRTVENWLNMNLAMLRNTIQALEVQRATIATLQSLSTTMANTMQGITDTVTGESTWPGRPDSDEGGKSAKTGNSAKGGEETESGDAGDEPVSPLIAQSAAWWQGLQDQFKQALGVALEGAAAASTASASPASFKTASPAQAAAKKTPNKTTRKAAPAKRSGSARSASKPASKPTGKRKSV